MEKQDASPLTEQYKDSKNFSARIELNRRFSTNPYLWTVWILDHIQFPKHAKVLELGCGNAILWRSNRNRIPRDAHILLSDFSKGMLEDARNGLGSASNRFEYEVINATRIPHPDNSFDIVIANLMLYHIPDRRKTLYEISRVLNMSGALYATAFGMESMKELDDLVSKFDNRINCSLKPISRVFGLENGKDQLDKYFEDVKLLKYHDELLVTEAEPLVNYVFSFTRVKRAIKDDEVNAFKGYVSDILENKGAIRIKKEAGMFIAKKPKK